jgi:Ser/Thr protein kinase RdoA (MazF antagonist)
VSLDSVLAAYGLRAITAARAPSGLIHQTMFVDLDDGQRVVAQRMHPIFAAPVLEDMDAITAHLAAAGMETPRLLRTLDGQLGVPDDEGKLWRILTFLAGSTVDRIAGPEMARAAGELVARFHAALAGLAHEFRFMRAGVHDTPAHLSRLRDARERGGEPGMEALADEILAMPLPAMGTFPRRVTHGDLKISNVLFRGGAAVALLDLDTMGRMTLAYELGDALRSWCNPLGEDVEETDFDLEVFRAAVNGYRRGARLDPAEAQSIVSGLETVCVELASRFATDAFEDKYFGWDPARFPSRREHNRVRAVGQLNLAKRVMVSRYELLAIVRSEFR